MQQISFERQPHLVKAGDYPTLPALYCFAIGICLIGRGEGCDIRVVGDGISRRHALIDRRGDAYYITDQQSSWGTFVNGERLAPLAPYRLPHEALIGLGSPQPALRFCDPDPTRPPPPALKPAPRPVLYHDQARQRFLLHGRVLDLPFMTYRLLVYLHEHAGVVCSPAACVTALWEIAPDSTDELVDRLYRIVSQLRRDLDHHQQSVERSQRVIVESQRRRGYSLQVPEELRS